MNSKTLQVHGMHCASCASIISKKVSKLPGVGHIEVNPGTEKAKISFDPKKTDINDMNQILEPLGYSLSDTESPEVMDMKHDHSMRDMNHESMEAE